MSFVAIMAATPENRVAKYMDFVTEPEAVAHIARFTGPYPDAFVVSEPAGPISHWLVDMVAKTLVISPPPPPDFDTIDQATVDRLLLESGVLRALAKALFQVVNDVRVLKGQGTISPAQFKTFLKGLIR